MRWKWKCLCAYYVSFACTTTELELYILINCKVVPFRLMEKSHLKVQGFTCITLISINGSYKHKSPAYQENN